MQLFYNNRVVNWHEHVWMNAQGELDIPDMERLIDSAEKTGMDTLLCSLPITSKRHCPPGADPKGKRSRCSGNANASGSDQRYVLH